MEIYTHLLAAGEVRKAVQEPLLLKSLNQYPNYYHLGSVFPDLPYLDIHFMAIRSLKKILFGYYDYKDTTKMIDLMHINCRKMVLTSFKYLDDKLRYYKNPEEKINKLSKDPVIQKELAFITGLLTHILCDYYMHYVVHKIECLEQKEFFNPYGLEIHQKVELGYLNLISRHLGHPLQFNKKEIKLPQGRDSMGNIRWFFNKEEVINDLIQILLTSSYYDSMSHFKINLCINNFEIIVKFLKYFKSYRKALQGKYGYEFNRFFPEGALQVISHFNLVVKKSALVLENFYQELLSGQELPEKLDSVKNLFKVADCSCPELFYFRNEIHLPD